MNKLVRNKVLGLILVVSMILGGLSVPTNAKTNALKQTGMTVEGHGLGKNYNGIDISKVKKSGQYKKYSANKTTYPKSYDLRELGRSTSVKNQGNYGTCWTFASMASMESNALTKGIGTYDLSEAHMAYFAYHNLYNPAPGLEGDKVYTQGNPWYNQGGNSMKSTLLLSKGYGPVLEEAYPYENLLNAPDETLVNSQNVLTMEEVYWMDGSDKNAMKQAIMENGAIVVGVCMVADDLVYNEENDALFISQAITDYNELYTNHDITVVGWDDDYSKNMFGSNKPKNNGAWLCKNSWGEDWGNHSGYFWLSYEDAPSRADFAYSYVVSEKGRYDDIYQHDGGAGISGYEGVDSAANIFTAREDIMIDAVGNLLLGATGNVMIYTGLTTNEPESGELVATKSFQENGWKWNTIKLDVPVAVAKDERFAIVFRYDGGGLGFIDRDTDSAYPSYYRVQANEGESLFGDGNGWTTMPGINWRIKAYTIDGKVSAKNTGSGAISLTWTPLNNATGYEIYRKDADTEYELLETVDAATTSYKQSNLEIGKTYTYKVVPVGLEKEKEFSTTIKTILAKPTGVSLSKTKKEVKVKWKSVSKAAKYEVYRKIGSGSYKKIKTVTKTYFNDTSVKKGKTYTYKVVAVAANKVKSSASLTKKIKF